LVDTLRFDKGLPKGISVYPRYADFRLATNARFFGKLASVRTVIVIVMCLGASSACKQKARPEPAAVIVKPAEPDPFDNTPTSFVVAGPRFTPGETAIIKVCVSVEGSIASSEVLESSGDKRFDEFARVWARRVKLRSMPRGDSGKDACGSVRVEIKAAPEPRMLSGADNLLG